MLIFTSVLVSDPETAGRMSTDGKRALEWAVNSGDRFEKDATDPIDVLNRMMDVIEENV